MRLKVVKIVRIISFIILVLLFVSTIKFLFPIIKSINTEEGRIIAQEKIKNQGILGMFLIIIIEILKIFTIFFPGEPIELLSGMCFGPVNGLIVICVGITISTFIISKIVKFLGIDFVKGLIKKEKYDKVNDMFEKYPKRVEGILFLLYFLPIVPKDFITYLGSLLPISSKRFLFISLVARFPAVFSSTLIGSFILSGNFIESLLVYVLTYSITGIFIVIYRYIVLKNGEIKENKKEEKYKTNKLMLLDKIEK